MLNILVAVGDRTSAELASIICKAAKHSATTVDDGVEAVVLLDSGRFDLIVTDLLLSKLDGVAMTRMIRASEAPYATIPIVGIAAKSDSVTAAAMLEAGMNEVIPRPFWKGALRTALDKLLAQTS